jgi:ribonuclease P protein component
MNCRHEHPFRKDERFRKKERLRKSEEFRETRREGRRDSSRRFVVYGRRTARAFSRLGVTASTKVGKATIRNWWKRRIREIFRRNKQAFPGGCDLVVIVKPDPPRAESEELRAELIGLFRDVAGRADA